MIFPVNADGDKRIERGLNEAAGLLRQSEISSEMSLEMRGKPIRSVCPPHRVSSAVKSQVEGSFCGASLAACIAIGEAPM